MTGACPPLGPAHPIPALGQTILVVEDRQISSLVRAVLAKRGYDATVVDTPKALAMLGTSASSSILITNTPGEFVEFSDRVSLVYLTSLPDPLWQGAFPKCRVVTKPFLPEELVRAVNGLCEVV